MPDLDAIVVGAANRALAEAAHEAALALDGRAIDIRVAAGSYR